MSHFACKEFSALEKELKTDLIECFDEAQQEMEAIINSIEDEGFSFAKLDNLFRSLHSMKGNCSVCFLDPLVDVLHRLEEIVDGMRGGYIAYHYTLGELINVVVEQVGLLLQDLYQHHGAEHATLVVLQKGLDELYAHEDTQQHPLLAKKILAKFSDETDVEDEPQPAQPLLTEVEYTPEQQADIDDFLNLSQKLNPLLGYSSERSERILKLCLLINAEIAEQTSPAQLSAAAYMHNMGMAMILKCKDDPVAKQQAKQNHTKVGAKLLRSHKGWEEAADIVEAHKERFDGSGYPEGIVGGMIPQGAFVLSMAVTFIDIVWGKTASEYNKSALQAVQSINFESGKGFPPHLVECFNGAIRKVLVAKRK